MKREARVLATHCEDPLCVGIVVRANSVDGVIISTEGCEGLRRRATETGYLDELRASVGPCDAGLPRAQEGRQRRLWALEFARALCLQLKELTDFLQH